MYNKKNWQWTDPNTDEVYELQHMQSFKTPFTLKFSKDRTTIVTTKVVFTNHCFSRVRTESDAKNQIIARETKKKRYD